MRGMGFAWRSAVPLVLTVGVLGAVLPAASAQAEAVRPLTLRGADRVIDRAFMTELAGDYAGARTALKARLSKATRPEEEPACARLRAWLRGMDKRQRAFSREGRTATGYWRAFQTLRDFGPARSGLFWQRAGRDLPKLEGNFESLAKIDLRFERVVGLDKDRAAWTRHLAGLLGKHGVEAFEGKPDARYEARIYLDAAEASAMMGRSRVTVEASDLLRNRDEEDRLVGSFSKRRSVTRPDEEAARRFAVRRVLDDLGWTLVYRIREDVLRDLAAP